ncbi:Cellulase [Syntrophobotulus glycolicus DSM 8271]|uniref:Cellulase n=1 Tax=Syntrophobotulus glycolicus (strain DSM 8271 / FlGlyR) TaxID=645991 RepID=F0SZJ2_SYNGF|nr:M20/M25/M40 family metallo-hydrolase [Syntrophobotulus glycolicus]ADY56078.1 Cellulase [Syntrophobotulus glycolicus DSM 8271]
MREKITLDYSVLNKLTQSFGPSGREESIRRLLISLVKDHCDEIICDRLGNLIVHKKGPGKKVLVAVHMDEIGLIITNVDPKGFLRYSAVGGLRSRDLVHTRVRFENDVYGMISKETDIYGEKKLEKYYIDSPAIEACSQDLIGEMAVLFGPYNESKDRVIAKSLDNRAGCFAAVEVLKQIQSRDDLYVVFTVQEEVGTRGAKIAANVLQPDLAIVLDATIADDFPENKNCTIALGKGCGIKVMDRSIIISPEIREWIAGIAREKQIPFQWEILDKGGTDSGPIHLAHGGILTGGISIPIRHIHTPGEIADKNDIQAAADLLYALLNTSEASERKT